MGTTSTRTVAIACSGGDASGMNTFIHSFVRMGLNQHGAKVIGIKSGYHGLTRACERIQTGELTVTSLRAEIGAHIGHDGLRRPGLDLVQLDHAAVSGLVGKGGTILGSARCERFFDPGVRQQVIDLLNGLGIETVVVVGGEGSLTGAAQLVAESCLTVVGVPATIDNDVPSLTEKALGFDTAVSNVVWAVERCRDTAESHRRVIVLETMGRNCGQIAEAAALASGAEIAVLPERGPLTGSKVVGIARRIERAMAEGLSHAIVVIAEGVDLPYPDPLGAGHALTAALQSYFRRPCTPVPGTEVRLCVLGHIQRGGTTTTYDRLLAAHYAEAAWDALAADPPRSGVVALRSGRFALHRFGDMPSLDSQASALKDYHLQKVLSRW